MPKKTDLSDAILELVRKPDYRPAKPRVIARRLQLPKDCAADVKKAIKKMVARGQLAYGADHMVMAADSASPKANRVVGTFRRKEAGFGFVRPTRSATGAAEAGGEMPDVYIPSRRAGDAATGDVVAVRLIDRRGKQEHAGPRGEIVEVIQRATRQFVGTYFQQAGSGLVQVDGALFSRPIGVGDPGASGATSGDKVVVEMIRFPSQIDDGEGVITEVLGARGKPGVDTLSIIREFNLPEDFPEDALEAARGVVRKFDESISGGRLDATGETVITIDPADAKDFDDAVSLVRTNNGNWRLGVHIADVSHFVRPRTPLDREALNRATSVYLPDRVIPMLPELISNGLASLQPGKVRYTKTVYMEFTADGLRVDTQVHSAAIKSNRRLDYEQVDQFLADPAPWRKRLGVKVVELLERMHELAMILRKRRIQRGALELSMPEVKIELDKEGRVTGASVMENTVSHQIIEEFMLAANEAVAGLLVQRELPLLRRIHESPAPLKLKVLTEFVNAMGIDSPSLQSRFELQSLLAKIAGQPEERAVNYAVLRSMQRAVYSPIEEGHYALASDCYCHFTSPIRRYPDLVVHRVLEAMIARRAPSLDYDQLFVLGEHCSRRAERAETAERELIKLKLLGYFRDRVGEEMDAVVTGVESFGLFVQGIELPAEGLIHVDSLADDYYRFDRATHTLSGHRSGNSFRLGDPVRVSVARVDLDRRELDFRLVARDQRKGRRPTGRSGQSSGSQKQRPATETKARSSPKGNTRNKTGPRGKPRS
jgi:ribonuclease R